MANGGGVLGVDGRQSEAAAAIGRGTHRLLRSLGFNCLPEVVLRSGRRADLVAVNARGIIWIVEIKSSVADFRADHKWQDYQYHCDGLLFATSPAVPEVIFPPDAGLIVADPYGGSLIRPAPACPLPSATRREMLLRFALTAADRLHRLTDPTAAELI